MDILIYKIIHIVGFVSWFAGIFYLGRILVYHREALDQDEPKKSVLTEQYAIMEGRVMKIILRPAMVITWVFGILMMLSYGWEWIKVNHWLHTKIGLLLVLTYFSEANTRWIRQLSQGQLSLSSQAFRLINEVPTIFLILIATLAVLKNNTNPITLIICIFGIILLLVILTKWYKKLRDKNTT